MSEFRFAVNVLPKPGILDPQGRAVELSLPHLNVTTCLEGPRRPPRRADRHRRRRGRGPRRRRRPRQRAAQQPAHRGLRHRAAGGDVVGRLAGRRGPPASVKIGVVTFPGSNSDVDSLNALAVAGVEAGHALARVARPAGRRRRSSCRAASPTATTSEPASSPASRR